jgi:chromosome segregation ATPase
MNEQIPPSSSNPSTDDLSASIVRVADKLQLISEAVKSLNLNRAQLEDKIEDAQKRIQHILSRLPEQSDGRQMNLLGEATPPTNSEDDNEPTTH